MRVAEIFLRDVQLCVSFTLLGCLSQRRHELVKLRDELLLDVLRPGGVRVDLRVEDIVHHLEETLNVVLLHCAVGDVLLNTRDIVPQLLVVLVLDEETEVRVVGFLAQHRGVHVVQVKAILLHPEEHVLDVDSREELAHGLVDIFGPLLLIERVESLLQYLSYPHDLLSDVR